MDGEITTTPGNFSSKSKNFVLKITVFCEREDILMDQGKFFKTLDATEYHDMELRAVKTYCDLY